MKRLKVESAGRYPLQMPDSPSVGLMTFGTGMVAAEDHTPIMSQLECGPVTRFNTTAACCTSYSRDANVRFTACSIFCITDQHITKELPNSCATQSEATMSVADRISPEREYGCHMR